MDETTISAVNGGGRGGGVKLSNERQASRATRMTKGRVGGYGRDRRARAATTNSTFWEALRGRWRLWGCCQSRCLRRVSQVQSADLTWMIVKELGGCGVGDGAGLTRHHDQGRLWELARRV